MTNKPTLVITGGSSGIGEATVLRFERLGYRVYNLDIQPADHGTYIECDVTDHDAVISAIKRLTDKQNIDVLICNAGVHFSATIEDTNEHELMQVFNLNVKGAYSATQAVLPSMRKANKGVILYVGSDQSLIAKQNSFAYNLSKHALASMAKTTAVDYAAYNIRANALCPGTIDTPLYRNAVENYCAKSGEELAVVHQLEAQAQPLNRIGKAEEVAAYAAFLASDEAAFITGSLQVMDGGYSCQ